MSISIIIWALQKATNNKLGHPRGPCNSVSITIIFHMRLTFCVFASWVQARTSTNQALLVSSLKGSYRREQTINSDDMWKPIITLMDMLYFIDMNQWKLATLFEEICIIVVISTRCWTLPSKQTQCSCTPNIIAWYRKSYLTQNSSMLILKEHFSVRIRPKAN